MRRWHFKRSLLLLSTFFLLGAGMLHAQTACPWLTEGTAAAYLGGDVTLTVHATQSGEGVCFFKKKQHSSFATLLITVSQKRSRTCPRSSPSITGVGSHAVACHSTRRGETKDTITGNVRNTGFTVRLITRNWPGNSAAQRSSIVEQAAEEVAGNLF